MKSFIFSHTFVCETSLKYLQNWEDFPHILRPGWPNALAETEGGKDLLLHSGVHKEVSSCVRPDRSEVLAEPGEICHSIQASLKRFTFLYVLAHKRPGRPDALAEPGET